MKTGIKGFRGAIRLEKPNRYWATKKWPRNNFSTITDNIWIKNDQLKKIRNPKRGHLLNINIWDTFFREKNHRLSIKIIANENWDHRLSFDYSFGNIRIKLVGWKFGITIWCNRTPNVWSDSRGYITGTEIYFTWASTTPFWTMWHTLSINQKMVWWQKQTNFLEQFTNFNLNLATW